MSIQSAVTISLVKEAEGGPFFTLRDVQRLLTHAGVA